MAGASCTEGVGCLRWVMRKELNGLGGFYIYCPFQFDINPFPVWFPACFLFFRLKTGKPNSFMAQSPKINQYPYIYIYSEI